MSECANVCYVQTGDATRGLRRLLRGECILHRAGQQKAGP